MIPVYRLVLTSRPIPVHITKRKLPLMITSYRGQCRCHTPVCGTAAAGTDGVKGLPSPRLPGGIGMFLIRMHARSPLEMFRCPVFRRIGCINTCTGTTSANLQKTFCLFGLFRLPTKLTSQPKSENLSHRRS
jgi:hypothetical protein